MNKILNYWTLSSANQNKL